MNMEMRDEERLTKNYAYIIIIFCTFQLKNFMGLNVMFSPRGPTSYNKYVYNTSWYFSFFEVSTSKVQGLWFLFLLNLIWTYISTRTNLRIPRTLPQWRRAASWPGSWSLSVSRSHPWCYTPGYCRDNYHLQINYYQKFLLKITLSSQ